MEKRSRLQGERRPLPSPTLLHKYLEELVLRDRKSRETGLHFRKEFISYYNLNCRASSAARQLRRLIQERSGEQIQEGTGEQVKEGTGKRNGNEDHEGTGEQTQERTGKHTQEPIHELATERTGEQTQKGSGNPTPPGSPTPASADHYHVTIAVDIEPSVDLVVALLAVLKLGAAYVPVDSVSAINRVKYVLHEARPVCILVDHNSLFKRDADTVWSKFFVLDIFSLLEGGNGDGNETGSDTGSESAKPQETSLVPEPRLMSMIYTSGSTGKPKGVCITHRSVMNRVSWQWEEYPFHQNEAACFKTSLLFVDSIIEIFSAILRLVPMVICPKGVSANPELFVQLLEEHRVSRLVMVPSMLKNILFYLSIAGGASRLPDLRLWICNSETLKPSLLQSFFDVFVSGKSFANFYGSTETMADCTSELFTTREDCEDKCVDGNLSIGAPMFNTCCYIVDEDLNTLPVGDIGEICVSGFNVADGYLDGEVSNKSFVRNPYAVEDGFDVLYKTGDFGRIHRGMIIYEGRRDSQIKIRGQRVNIAEIENVINACPGVDKSVVLCHQFSDVSSVIVGHYTTLSRKRHTRLESAILEQCRKSLPPYMRPKLLFVDEIPLQPTTGKVDRVALRKKYERAFNRQSSRELDVVDDKGRKALNILALNLNLPTSAVSKNSSKSFFELGGNSVSMIATIVQLKGYGLHIPIEEFSCARTVQEIVTHVTISCAPIGETLETDR